MKTNILSISLLFLSFAALSQESSSSNYTTHRIGLNIGFSSALNNFGDTDADSDKAGFAKGGIIFDLSYNYRFDENLALSINYGSTANTFDAQSFANILGREEPGLDWTVEANPYGIGYFTAGVKGMTGDNVIAYLNPMIGFASMIAPEIGITATDRTTSLSQTVRESDPSVAFIFGLAFGIDIKASDLISINFEGLYLNSEFEIDQEIDTFDAQGNPVLVSSNYDQPYSTLNFSLGIDFNF